MRLFLPTIFLGTGFLLIQIENGKHIRNTDLPNRTAIAQLLALRGVDGGTVVGNQREFVVGEGLDDVDHHVGKDQLVGIADLRIMSLRAAFRDRGIG